MWNTKNQLPGEINIFEELFDDGQARAQLHALSLYVTTGCTKCSFYVFLQFTLLRQKVVFTAIGQFAYISEHGE